jgi:hypothetical protein
MNTSTLLTSKVLGVRITNEDILFCGEAVVTLPENVPVRDKGCPLVTFTGVVDGEVEFLFGHLKGGDLDDLVGIDLSCQHGTVTMTLIGGSNYISTRRAIFSDVASVFTILK